MPWAFAGTRMALDHSLTHSILINLFIKVKLNTLILPPLLSITFVPSTFYAYVWHILEGTSKAYIFSRNKRDGFCMSRATKMAGGELNARRV